MYQKIITQSPLNIVTLEEAKAQCRVMNSFTLDDTYITMLISSASELVQSYVNKPLSDTTVTLAWAVYRPSVGLWGYSAGDVVITSVTADLGTVDITDYTYNDVTGMLTIPTSYSNFTGFNVTYDVTVSTVSDRVKHSTLMMISTLYNNREDNIVGMTVEEMPLTSMKLLDSERHYYEP